MHALAKRIYNLAPADAALTFDDGETYTFELASAEFFQDDFQGEATRPDDPGAVYRIVGDADGVFVGRQGPDEDGWATFGEVVAVDAA